MDVRGPFTRIYGGPGPGRARFKWKGEVGPLIRIVEKERGEEAVHKDK